MLLHPDSTNFKSKGQGHTSKFTATGRNNSSTTAGMADHAKARGRKTGLNLKTQFFWSAEK